jgi:hypothetical protein
MPGLGELALQWQVVVSEGEGSPDSSLKPAAMGSRMLFLTGHND